MNKVFLHVDLDAFFASVEQLDNPEYRNKPVIVGGLPDDRRAVVSTASYEARKFGVHSAMPIFQAYKLCPHGIFLRGRMKRYHEKSEEVMAIFRQYSPDIQQISVDEAFIDLTGTERLFGSPLETAKKLKAQVLEETGLTVSVGLSATKYCAKIASGLQKPDGLTIVPAGKEIDFMLSLPLNKIWGVGRKTLEKLDNYGIKTSRDIFNRSEKLLQSLFGNAAGSFLYNAVRGNEGADFRAEPKSRSISAESTYEYDLTSLEIIETALLQLCHTVMFRSLREKVRSSTVAIKIRYEDFSTVSVQSSGERYISSIDDLFDRAKALLEKKIDLQKGIRLLGVGMQNLEDEKEVRQQELFDFGEEKKRRLESAILKAQEKNPGLKITSARLLGSTSLILAMLFFGQKNLSAQSFSGQDLPSVEKQSTSTEKEADGAAGIVFDTSRLPLSDSGKFVSLFNKDLGNQNVEFFAQGYWKSTVTGGATYSFGFGTTPTLSTVSPVFMQNVDLTLYFMLNHHWYFEAAFADEFTKNTVAAGYMGDGYLKKARISNRKIVFPTTYSIDDVSRGIGGGDNQAPGISLNWKGEKWQADTVFRYDMLQAHEKTWYGKNSVSKSDIALSSYNTGNFYYLPKASLVRAVKDIYVENSSGTYRDSKGRKYKKLDSSQFLLLATENQILLSKDAGTGKKNGLLPAVAVTFYTSVSQSDFGSYNDESTFLGKIQAWFSQKGSRAIKIENYAYPLINSIDGEDCLFLQHPAGFSPLVVASSYDTLSSSASDARIADSQNGTADTNYNVVIDEDRLTFAQTDFFYQNHLYATVSLNEDSAEDELDRAIESNFPLAKEFPFVYLGSASSSISTKVLQLRTLTPVKRLEIGTKAVGGSVTVYKNGVIDSSAKYDAESGTINLSSAVAASDHITARWYEESEDSSSGAFSMAAGFKYFFTDNFSGDISASSRWSYNNDREYADESASSRGFVTLANAAAYKKDNFSAKNTLAISYENPNTTGNYRILGNDDKESKTYYLSKTAGINLPGDYEPCLNIKENAGTSHIQLKESKKYSSEAAEGSSDSEISGYAIPFEWNFTGIDAGNGENQAWAAQSIYIPGLTSSLANASTFSIAIKRPSTSSFSSSDAALYLQLGVSSDKDFSVEEGEKIPTWKISDSSAAFVDKAFDFSDSSKEGKWQIVKVTLTDEDRSAISSLCNFNARLIFCSNQSSGPSSSGLIYAGPYECGELVFNSESSVSVTTKNYQTTDPSLSSSAIKKFNKTKSNKVQYFEWKFDQEESEGQEITFTRNFTAVDFSEYKKLSFFLKAEKADSIKIQLSSPKSGDSEKKTLVYTIDSPSSEWNEYTIDLNSSGDKRLSYLNVDIPPTKISITVTSSKEGNFSFDELYLSENTPFVLAEDKIEANYKIDGAILKSGNHELLKNVSISANANAATAIETEKGRSKEKSLKSSGSLDFTLVNVKVKSQLSLSNAYLHDTSGESSQKNALAQASHSLENEKALLGLFSFSENYSYSSEEASLEKANSAKFDFASCKIPLKIEASTKASSDSWSLRQKLEGNASLTPGKFSFSVKAASSQSVLTDSAGSSSSGRKKFSTENYFASWKEITAFSFDGGDEKAAKRSVSMEGKASRSFLTANFKPSLFFSTEGNYKSSSKVSFSDTSKAGFELPFTLAKNNFSFSWKKSAGASETCEKGGDYKSDTEKLSSALGDKSYFFTSLPIYDLISSSLSENVLRNDEKSQFYTGNYAFSWRRPFFANKYDFFIPQSAKIEATRDIRTGSSTSDFYQIKNTLSYSAMNIFGRRGSLPMFSFFESDEYISSLSAAFKIPRTAASSFSYILNAYIQATFYLSEKDYLRQGLDGSIEGKEDWKGKYTIVWKRGSKSSLARGIVSIFSEKMSESTLKITKTDSINLSLSSASASSSVTRKYAVSYSHATETQVTKYISINTDLLLGYYANWGKSAQLSMNASLGGTIKF